MMAKIEPAEIRLTEEWVNGFMGREEFQKLLVSCALGTRIKPVDVIGDDSLAFRDWQNDDMTFVFRFDPWAPQEFLDLLTFSHKSNADEVGWALVDGEYVLRFWWD